MFLYIFSELDYVIHVFNMHFLLLASFLFCFFFYDFKVDLELV